MKVAAVVGLLAVLNITEAHPSMTTQRQIQENSSRQGLAQKNITPLNMTRQNLTQHDITRQNITHHNITRQNLTQQRTRQNIIQHNLTQNITRQNQTQQNIIRQNLTKQKIRPNITRQNLTQQKRRQNTIRQKLTEQNIARQNRTQQINTQFCSNLLKIENLYFSLYEQRNISILPADFSVHWKTGNVFFTLINEELRMNIVVLHPNGEFKTIRVNGLGQSTVVDNLNDIVYLATDNGIYIYKEDDDSVRPYAALDKDVMYMAVSDNGSTIYIATWPQNRVYKITKITNGGHTEEQFPLIPNGHCLRIDTNNNMYFIASKTTYILKNGDGIAIKIKGLPSDITGVFINRSGKVYAMDESSNLYRIRPETASAKHLGTFRVTGVNAFAVDGNDVLIGTQGAIMRFKAYENTCS